MVVDGLRMKNASHIQNVYVTARLLCLIAFANKNVVGAIKGSQNRISHEGLGDTGFAGT